MQQHIEHFLSATEEQAIIEAIQIAENNTSGEIRVHIENTHNDNLNHRVLDIFSILKMHNTKLRNGVLIYVAVQDKAFAIYGDKSIHCVVPPNFWDSTTAIIESYFQKREFKQGLIFGIKNAGIQLKKYFPCDTENPNELPNEISTTL